MLNNESVEQALCRLMSQVVTRGELDVRFCLKYKMNKYGERKEAFLFVIFLEDVNLIDVVSDTKCRYWSIEEIESMMGQGVFCDQFEKEYNHLRFVIQTWLDVNV